MIALHVAPRRAREVAGVVGYSGALLDAGEDEIRARPPILLIHGDADPMVPITAFHSASAALTQLGFPLATHVSPGVGHSIDMAGLMMGAGFLAHALA
jgi:phospholipase/carboxylesterase